MFGRPVSQSKTDSWQSHPPVLLGRDMSDSARGRQGDVRSDAEQHVDADQETEPSDKAPALLFICSGVFLCAFLISISRMPLDALSVIVSPLLSFWLGVLTVALCYRLGSSSKEKAEPQPAEHGIVAGLETREAAVSAMAEHYCLSARESEVLSLLIQGRNAQRISSLMTISPSTAKTHIYNIYRKLGVHSLQEVIDLFENRISLKNDT